MKNRNQHILGRFGLSSICTGLCTVTFSLLAAGPAAHADDATWDGDTDALWATAGNWNAAIPGLGNTATFNSTTSFNPIDVGTISLSKIVFDTANTAAYTLGTAAGTGSIILADGTTTAVDMTSSVVTNQIINANLTLGTAIASTTTFSNTSPTGLLTLAGGITGGTGGAAAGKTVTIAGATTISGIISNGGATSVSLNKAAIPGLSILSGNNSYTGNTTINASGILRAGNNNALGTAGTVTITGLSAVLELADGININRALTVSGVGGKKFLRLQDGAISGEYSGAITIQENITPDFELSASAGGTLTLSGEIGASPGSNINKAGAGTLVISGNNTLFDKSVTINGGVLRAANSNAFGNVGTVTITNTGSVIELANGVTISRALTVNDTGNNKTIRLQDTATTGEYSGAITISEINPPDFDVSASSGGTLTLSGAIGASAGANINKEGIGTVALSGDNSAFDRNVTINVGVLRAGHNNAFGSIGTVSLANTDTTLELANGITINRALTVSNTGNKKTIALQAGATSAEYSGDITNSEESNAVNFEASIGSSGTLTLSGVVSGSGVVNTGALTKTGVGTLVLSGIADNTSIRPLVVSVTAGELHLGKTSSATVQAVYGISGIANGATVKLTGTGGNQIYSANASNLFGIHGMVAGSTFDLNGNSETLTFLEGTGGIVNGGSGTPTLTIGDKSVGFEFGGAIQDGSGTLALTKILAGTVTLSGANTYTGATTISSGTLILTGATQATSAISSSTTGKLGLDIGSPVTAANATVTFTSRTVLVTGTPTLASYTLLTASSIVGTPTLAAPAPSGYSLQVVDNNKLLLVQDAPSDPFVSWAGIGVLFDADANNDGVENGLAWFLGALDKDTNANGLLPKVSQTAGALVLEFDCLDAAARGAAVFQVQYSNNLTAWAGTDVPSAEGTFTAGVVDFVVTDPAPVGGNLKVVATIPVAQAGAGKLFGRIQGVK